MVEEGYEKEGRRSSEEEREVEETQGENLERSHGDYRIQNGEVDEGQSSRKGRICGGM
jgi:hypothetical protein